eukprot:gene24823-28058_t
MRENNEEDNSGSQADLRLAASNLASKMNVVLKSVTSMDRLVQSPAKKVQQAVAVIESEVVMHVNKTQLGSNTNKADAKEKEKEKEKEKAEKAAAHKAAQRLPEPAVPISTGVATPSDSAHVGTGVVAATQTQTSSDDTQSHTGALSSTTPGKPPIGGIAANAAPAKATRTVGIQANLMRGIDPTAVDVPTISTATSPHMVDHQQIEQQHDQSLHSASGDDDKSVDGKSVPSASHASHSSHAHAKKATAGSKKVAHHPKKKITHSQKHPHAEHPHLEQHHDSHDHVDTSSSVQNTAGSHTDSKKAGTVMHGLPEGAEVHEALRDLSIEDIVSHVQRARTQEAIEAQLRAEAEIEIKRRVKQALTAAANKDYSGFALAVGSKSPHSRQTFAKYTGRPVSQGSQSGLSININGAEFSATPTAANTARGSTDASRNVSFLASAVPEETNDLNAPTLVVDVAALAPNSTGAVMEVSSTVQEVPKVPESNVSSAGELSSSQPSNNIGYAVPPPLVFETPENTYSTTQHIQYHAQQGPSPSVKPAALSSLSVLSTMEERRSNAASFRQSARSSDGTVATLRDLPEDGFEPDAQARPEDQDDVQYNQNGREAHLSTVGGSLDTNSQWGARLPMLDGSIDMMEPFAASALLARQGGPP